MSESIQEIKEIKSIYAQDREGNTPLHLAAKAGDVDEVQRLIKAGQADVNAKNKAGATALHLAAKGNHLDIIQCLLTNGAEINALDDKKNTPFHYAAKKGCVDALRLLKDNHADLNAVSVQGNTALHFSAINGRESATEFLLEECKLNINQQNTGGWTALHFAITNKYLEVCQLLIEHRADINLRNDTQYTALHYAVELRDETLSKKMVEYLLENKADVAAQNNDEWTPLHVAAWRGHLDVCKVLVDHKADINAQNKLKATPMMTAAINGRLNVVQWFIAQGVDINARGERQRTALHEAAQESHEEVVDYLLDHKADATAKDENGTTPLHLSAQEHLGICKKLVDRKADVHARGNEGGTVLNPAVLFRRMNIVKWLIEDCHVDINAPGYLGRTALHVAAGIGDKEMVVYLLDHKANITVRDKKGLTPLHRAANNGHLEVCKLLVASGANVNAVTKEGGTPMHFAALNGEEEVVQWFIEERHVDIDRPGRWQATALHNAVSNGHLDLSKWLVDHKANINARRDDGSTLMHLVGTQGVAKWLIEEHRFSVNTLDKHGRTPLHLAVLIKNKKVAKELIEYLIEKGAYVFAKDVDGEAPLRVAVEEDSIETAKLLLKHNGLRVMRSETINGIYTSTVYYDDALQDLAKEGSEMRKLLKNFTVDAECAKAISKVVWSRALSEGDLVIPPVQSIIGEYVICKEFRPVIEVAEEALLGFAEDLKYSSAEELDVIAAQVISLMPSPDDCITYWAQLKAQFEKDPKALGSVPRPSKPDKAVPALKSEEREEKHRVSFAKAVPMNGDPDATTVFSMPASSRRLGSFGLFDSSCRESKVSVSEKSQDERPALVAPKIH